MNITDYDYDLPEELIAQQPLMARDESRMMVLSGNCETITHSTFNRLPEFLSNGDLLVVNDTKVFPARLNGVKQDTGGFTEIFLLRPYRDDTWEALSRPAKRLRVGTVVVFGNKELYAEIIAKGNNGHVQVRLTSDGNNIDHVIDRIGKIPLPPYIRRDPSAADKERYQTVYARERGAVAAPTAGLHFSEALLDNLADKGIDTASVTLHVGIGTFRPLTEADADSDRLHREYCSVTPETVNRIVACRESGGRVIAVGTTTARALESASTQGVIAPYDGRTDIFIKPPYTFKSVDAMITNFHLPRSSLLMMVSAFAGRERILTAYDEAVREHYRFFSYGDAMLIFGGA
ncbi:tRNA preQ1(34) S-adenosylmethionine ribosyltransferase-isomerase QueA [Candidatus Latescibacterota bacterium]